MSNLNVERVTEVRHHTDSLFSFKTTRDPSFRFLNGQFTMIGLQVDGRPLLRAYSMVSANHEEELEFFSIKVANGPLTSRLAHIKPGDEILVGRKPTGTLVQDALLPGKRLYLAGTGTGLAPLYGIVRDALEAGHTGPIWLFHGARDMRGLYLVDELRALAARHPNLQYRPSVLEGRLGEGYQVGALDALIRAECPKPVGFSAFLCGHPDLVLSLRKKLFLAGLSLKDIHADAFLPSTGPENAGAARAPHASR